ncbi:hypothetical protein [Alishewanella longhuensis]
MKTIEIDDDLYQYIAGQSLKLGKVLPIFCVVCYPERQ